MGQKTKPTIYKKEIKQLALHLTKGNRKGALAVIRDRINNHKPETYYQELAWKGWERAVSRREPESLINQLLIGLTKKEVAFYLKTLKEKADEITIRDHEKEEWVTDYFPCWLSLLNSYMQLCK
jgi:hypothetical protein